MLDIKYVREHPKEIEQAAKAKGVSISLDELLQLDNQYRVVSTRLQTLQQEKNQAAKTRDVEKGKKIKQDLTELTRQLEEIDEKRRLLLENIPNPAKPDVPVGKDESENKVIKKFKEPTKFSFTPKDHLALGEALDIIDVSMAAKISGSRFDYLKNEGVLLEQALKQLAFDVLLKEGFIPVIPPVLIKKEIMHALGYTAMGEAENIYEIAQDDLYLVGTSEQSVVPLHMNQTLRKEDLPRRYVGFSTCFRRESGSYGKDTRGIFRVHQFNKVEMVSLVAEGQDDKEHEYLLSLEEKLFQMLEIPYQVVLICTGDLGFNAARKYDIEAWIPSQQKYREVTSTSTTTDFQSRRLNMKYHDGNEKKYLQVLNGTAFSMNRPIIAILENYQQEDGSVIIPAILQKYIGKTIIKPHTT